MVSGLEELHCLYSSFVMCSQKKKKLPIMRWQLIACLQRYSDFVVLEQRVQRYRVEFCAETMSVCSSGTLSTIPKSPELWLILCACPPWQPGFPQPGADSIHFLFLCSIAQSIVTLKGLAKQDQRSHSSCLTKSHPPFTDCLCSATKSVLFC